MTANPIILKTLDLEVRGPYKSPSPFSFESEVQKLKIYVPLIELVKSEVFKKPILDALELKALQASNDYVNLQDDKLVVVLSPMTELVDENFPSFYVSLTIHDKILHKYLLNTCASHNLMPKAVMEELGLDITRPYHDLFSFDSRKVKCLGLIKDLAITLTQLPMKRMMMDIVVADAPLSLVCYFPEGGLRGWVGHCKMTCLTPLSQFLEEKEEDYTRRLSWPIPSMMRIIPLIIPFTLWKLILEHVFSKLNNPIRP